MKNNKQFKNGHSGTFTLKNLAAAVILSSVAGTASADIEIGKAGNTTISMFGILDAGVLTRVMYRLMVMKKLVLKPVVCVRP